MTTINLQQARNQLSRYVEQAASGKDIIISRAGKPVALLTAYTPIPDKKRKLGLGRSRFKVPVNFDRLYQDQIQKMFESGT